jgi:hypothetical protein
MKNLNHNQSSKCSKIDYLTKEITNFRKKKFGIMHRCKTLKKNNKTM